MLKMKVVPVAMRIASKIDVKSIAEELKKVQIDDKAASAEKKTEIGFAVIGAILPELGKVADDVIELVAVYKEISVEEAGELDAIAVLKEMAADTGLTAFFKSALQRQKRGQK